MFEGTKMSCSVNMRVALVSVQRGLERSGLHVNLLEPVQDGYRVELGDGKLEGSIRLIRQTTSLTTLDIKIKKNAMRQDSIELALLEVIKEQNGSVSDSDAFDFSNYRAILARQDTSSERVGWLLPSTPVHLVRFGNSGWLYVRMPSGRPGYLKSNVAARTDK